MSILSQITGAVKAALGLPSLVPMGIKRTTARLLTFGLKRLGFDVTNVVRQSGEIFDKPVARDIIKVIEGAAQRMELQTKVGNLADDVRFARSFMFETKFRSDRNYRYFAFVTIHDKSLNVSRSKWVSFYGTENMTKDEIANWYEQNMLTEYHKAQFELEGYNVFEIWHNEGNPY